MKIPTAFPRDIDVNIQIQVAQIELATDMSLLCILTPNAVPSVDTPWQPSSRVKLYSNINDFVKDFPPLPENGDPTDPTYNMYMAGVAFFGQPLRPQYLAVGRVFTQSQTANDPSIPPAGATWTSDAYTFTDFPTEIANTAQFIKNMGTFAFAWALDRSYRDLSQQIDLSTYCQANAYRAAAFLCTNAASATQAVGSGGESNIGYTVFNLGNFATDVFYHDDPQFYPEVSYATIALSVNYSLPGNILTMKFKDLPGIPPVGTVVNFDQTSLQNVLAKNINTFTLVGNSTRTVREGTQAAFNWFTDMYIGLANFNENLQVELFNVFLQNRVVPYTTQGQMLLVAAAQRSCQRYVANGLFADRIVSDPSSVGGARVEEATQVIPTPIEQMSQADRASRTGPPIQITVYLAGAIHRVNVFVNAVQ